MARAVTCQITKEKGTSDTFIKINGKWYKSQEIYDIDRQKKQTRIELVDYICREFLGYSEGQPFNTSMVKKLQDLKFYDDDVILEAFKDQQDIIHRVFETKEFKNETQKISYMFAIVRNNIADVNKRYKQKTVAHKMEQSTSFIDIDLVSGTKKHGKDISAWLGDD